MVRRGRRDQRGIALHGEQKYLGELQARIMEIVWTRGRVTVRDVVDDLAPERDLAYTTVMTVMTRLATEGMLARERLGKIYWYRATRTRDEFRAALSSSIVHDLLVDFGDVALAQFAETLAQVDPARLARLRAFMSERERSADDT